MKGMIALFALSLWIIWLFHLERKERPAVSSAIWIVLIWVIIHSTRTTSAWLGLQGSQSRDEGSPIDAAIELVLLLLATTVLLRRNINWSQVIRGNIWVFVFYIFWFTSITWSDYPFITLKRVFKDFGNVIMVLIVLTEGNSWESFKAVLVRMAYLCIPLSIVLIRYYPEWGRATVGYHLDGTFYNGVASHKNVLGIVVLASTLGLLWDLLDHSRKIRHVVLKFSYVSRVLMFCMCWYLFVIIDSASSLVAAILGVAVTLMFQFPAFRRSPVRMEIISAIALSVVLVLDLLFNVKEAIVVGVLGRDMTLTSRTDMWQVLESYVENPIVGAGFNTFWTGDRLLLLPEHLQGNVQAHNGYLELYLNGGIVGVGLLAVLIFTGYRHIRKRLTLSSPEDIARLVVLVSVITHNYTEASFTKIGVLWFATIFAFMEYGKQKYASKAMKFNVRVPSLPSGWKSRSDVPAGNAWLTKLDAPISSRP